MSLPLMDQTYLPSQDDGTQHNTSIQVMISSQDLGLATSQPFDPNMMIESPPPDLNFMAQPSSQQQQQFDGVTPLVYPSSHLMTPALGLYDPGNFLGGDPFTLFDSSLGASLRPTHPSLLKTEHKSSRAARRGPMDEMRQLVRIMVKLIPDSGAVLVANEGEGLGGGGNRVSEPEIKEYLQKVLGSDAPQPEWGLPEGWGAYLAELFSWASGRKIDKEDAIKCARRLPGRSWECVEHELHKLGLYPERWQLPLRQEEVQLINIGDPPISAMMAGSSRGTKQEGESILRRDHHGVQQQPEGEESEGGADADDEHTAANVLLGLTGNPKRLKTSYHPVGAPHDDNIGILPAPNVNKSMQVVEKKPVENLDTTIFDKQNLKAMSFIGLTHGLKEIYETLEMRSHENVPFNEREFVRFNLKRAREEGNKYFGVASNCAHFPAAGTIASLMVPQPTQGSLPHQLPPQTLSRLPMQLPRPMAHQQQIPRPAVASWQVPLQAVPSNSRQPQFVPPKPNLSVTNAVIAAVSAASAAFASASAAAAASGTIASSSASTAPAKASTSLASVPSSLTALSRTSAPAAAPHPPPVSSVPRPPMAPTVVSPPPHNRSVPRPPMAPTSSHAAIQSAAANIARGPGGAAALQAFIQTLAASKEKNLNRRMDLTSIMPLASHGPPKHAVVAGLPATVSGLPALPGSSPVGVANQHPKVEAPAVDAIKAEHHRVPPVPPVATKAGTSVSIKIDDTTSDQPAVSKSEPIYSDSIQQVTKLEPTSFKTSFPPPLNGMMHLLSRGSTAVSPSHAIAAVPPSHAISAAFGSPHTKSEAIKPEQMTVKPEQMTAKPEQVIQIVIKPNDIQHQGSVPREDDPSSLESSQTRSQPPL